MFANVDLNLSQAVAENIGVKQPKSGGSSVIKSSPALSQNNTIKKPDTRNVAVLIEDGFDDSEVKPILDELRSEGIQVEIISEKLGIVNGTEGAELEVDFTFLTGESVLFDAVYVVGGPGTNKKFNGSVQYFINEAFSHFKPIGVSQEGKKLVKDIIGKPGVIVSDTTGSFGSTFIGAIAAHRFWNRLVG